MTAKVHVLCGPRGSGKTEALLERFRQRTREAPGTTLWLAPTRHAVMALRERLLAAGGLFGCRLATFAELAAEVLRHGRGGRLLSGGQRPPLADEVVSELQAEGRLPHFSPVSGTRGFADGLGAALGELQRAGISPDALARAAGGGGLGEPVGFAKGRECAAVDARYRNQLNSLGLIDPNARESRAAGVLRKGCSGLFSDIDTIFLDGFSDFTAGEHALLDALAGPAAEVWVSLPDDAGNERAELFSRSRSTRGRLAGFEPQSRTLPARQAQGTFPAGLVHLERQLFRPIRLVIRGGEACGLEFIEAPGMLGEARLVARSVRRLLAEGTPADDVLVVLREVEPYADLLREVFDEYAVPLEVEGEDTLTRAPAVALLLKAAGLPEEGWPFAGVTALLRHTYFRPH
jgi:ATP-dependent helicase/nuclease subunit B